MAAGARGDGGSLANLLLLEDLAADGRLHASGGAKQMADRSLGRRDLDLGCVLFEGHLVRERLELVVERRRRSVSIDVADRVRRQLSGAQGAKKACGHALALGMRSGDVEGVAVRSIAG